MKTLLLPVLIVSAMLGIAPEVSAHAAPPQVGAAPHQSKPHLQEPAAASSALSSHHASILATTASNGLRREVFGYATSGSLGDPTIGYPSWNFDLLSTVAFFAIHVDPSGVLVADSNWTVWNSSTLTGLVSTAHAHGVKVVVTLRNPSDMCGALFNSDTTTLQIVKEVVAKGVDGVNIDYEGQLVTCPSLFPEQTDQQMLTTFAQRLRTALDNQRAGYYLSIATYSGSASGTDGFFNIAALNPYVDSFFVMAYDMDYANQGLAPLQGCSSFCMAPVSPLTNYYWNDTTSMNQYVALVGAGKVILGQPYYGRVACVGGPAVHAVATSTPTAATYTDAAAAISSPDVQPGTYSINRDPNDPTGQDRWDSWYDLRLGCWREMYWSDTTQLAMRYNLINQDSLRGVGLWTLNYGGGAPELWSTLKTYFVNCTSASLSANPVSPQLSGTAIQLTASAATCANPRYEFWFLPPGGTWRLVQGYSSTATFTWKTAGTPPGTYTFSVWARDASSTATYDAYDSSLAYTLTTSPCTAVSLSYTPASPGALGVPVAVTGAATGCPNPSYQFWLLPPGGSWTLVQGYSTNATYKWVTTGRSAGTYLFSVWARDASSIAGYDAYDSSHNYALALVPCTAATASYAPASPASIGTPVTVTGSVTGCPNPLYEFWLLPPGGSWTLVQGYGPTATYSWNTAGRAAGTYLFSVWARDAASSAAYDTYDSSHNYALTVTPCTAVSVSYGPAPPSSAGTPVTVTGTATGCPNPRYQFWLLPPGGTWTLVQGYSASTTFNWSTTGRAPGSYLFSVWARDASSSAGYDAYDSSHYYALN
jgi:spore germination protein YaaH